MSDWKFTKDFNIFKDMYSHLLNNEYDVYDRNDNTCHRAVVIGFKQEKHYNTIECSDIETGEILHINENYINFNNDKWWVYNKMNRNGFFEFKEYYKNVIGKKTVCCYYGTYHNCEIKDLNSNYRYNPVFICNIDGKECDVKYNDLNVTELSDEEWKDKHMKSNPEYIRRVKFIERHKDYINKTLEVYDNKNKEIVFLELTEVDMKSVFHFTNGYNTTEHFINFNNDRFEFFKKFNLDPIELYKEKYADYIGKEITYFHNYELFTGTISELTTSYKKQGNVIEYDLFIIVNDSSTGNLKKIRQENVNIESSKKWIINKEKEIKNHNDEIEHERRISEIIKKNKKKQEEERLVEQLINEKNKKILEQFESNEWKDLIGKTYQCFYNSQVGECVIESVNKTKKNKFIFNCKTKNGKTVILKSNKINIFNDDKFLNKKLVEQKTSKLINTNGSSSREQAEYKNHMLVCDFESMRDCMCGVGTRKVKLMLNKKIKEHDKIAELYRLALEVEDCNISAKKYRGSYKLDYYEKKTEKLKELVDLCLIYNDEHEENKVIYGKEMSSGRETNAILYFELPGCEQISFHTSLSKNDASGIPNYGKAWDGKVNSTMWKLEQAINELYYKHNE